MCQMTSSTHTHIVLGTRTKHTWCLPRAQHKPTKHIVPIYECCAFLYKYFPSISAINSNWANVTYIETETAGERAADARRDATVWAIGTVRDYNFLCNVYSAFSIVKLDAADAALHSNVRIYERSVYKYISLAASHKGPKIHLSCMMRACSRARAPLYSKSRVS